MSDNEGSVPTEGIDYGDTMVVWPSTGRIPGGDVKPGGSSGLAPSMPPGWGDYSPQGIALVQSVRKRLVRTVLIFTESSDQLSRATDRVPGLPASPGYVQ